jgi:DNA polymerase III subunit delta'
MNNLEPINQKKLFGLEKYLSELIRVYEAGIYPNKLLLSGQKGTGKSTLAFHFINYVLSEDEDTSYDKKKNQINSQSPTFKTILNQSNPNLSIIDIKSDKKSIDINQIRELILNLNKSSFNTKPRFVLIDNIEYLNINSINALLKVLEEPNSNIYFILINNNKKILATLLSRCVNYKIYLTNKESLKITNSLFSGNLKKLINDDLIDYYLTPGKLYNLIKFAELHQYNLIDFDLRKLLKIIIKDNHYKKDLFMKYMIYDLIEFYFRKLNSSFSKKVNDEYSYFLKKISDTKNFNLDEESLFIEFQDEILNG